MIIFLKSWILGAEGGFDFECGDNPCNLRTSLLFVRISVFGAIGLGIQSNDHPRQSGTSGHASNTKGNSLFDADLLA